MLLNGIGVLLPWNMFITIAPNYYVEYWFTVDGNKTSYAKSFMSALGISAQIPNFCAGFINVLQIIGGSLMIRIVSPLIVNCLNVIAILALIIFQDPSEDGDNALVLHSITCYYYDHERFKWSLPAMHWFYIVSLVIIMIMNASNGLYQNSVFGLAADFPATYTNALVVGTNISGTFISVLAVVTTAGQSYPLQHKVRMSLPRR
ncbi:hypothetical protein OESDEN_12070 [Oesophagostomum dentatum]|uniref:Nucleoside transporter n=1 Tax=Oesophagostomum dentatum TaxID=61180 RepID=A0A0B1ST98_OESDE|nr:hypothetical protein OESDEN_12070 [Oesophagostomum dentatum]